MLAHRALWLTARRLPQMVAALALLALPRQSFAIERLGNNVVPSIETLQLNLDPRQDKYSGVATIQVEVKAATDTVRFTAKEMTLEGVSLVRKGGDKKALTIPLKTTVDDEGIVTAVAGSK